MLTLIGPGEVPRSASTWAFEQSSLGDRPSYQIGMALPSSPFPGTSHSVSWFLMFLDTGAAGLGLEKNGSR